MSFGSQLLKKARHAVLSEVAGVLLAVLLIFALNLADPIPKLAAGALFFWIIVALGLRAFKAITNPTDAIAWDDRSDD
ncbi:hypothetical protein [Croceicoccus sp. Ery15]|uniref:hypothetical protein n=1 Tax=Croceicoccus sp. Ery15 TaxID=1703338 RepID=UPI001E4CB00D|nr:hypothetical protein [Croceicoccus sp. Ery15]